MILTFFKGLLRELWLLVKDPRGIFMFLVAPLLMNIVVCGAFQNGIVNHIPLAAVEMSSSAKTRELIRAFDESDRFDVTLVLQDLDEAKQKMEEGEVYGIIVIPADYTRSLQLGQQAEVLVGINSANNLVGNSAVVSVMQVVKTVSSQIAVKSYVASGSTVAEGTAKVMPISTVLRPWFNPQFSYLMYLGLGLTGLVYHQLFLSAVAGSFADEKKEGILSGKFRKRDAILYYFDKMLFYGIAGFFNLLLNYAVIMKIYSFPMRGARADFLLLSAWLRCASGAALQKFPACDAVAHGADLSVFRTGRLFLAAYGNAGFSGTDCKLSARHPLPRPRPQYHSDGHRL